MRKQVLHPHQQLHFFEDVLRLRRAQLNCIWTHQIQSNYHHFRWMPSGLPSDFTCFPLYNFLKLPEMRKTDLHVGKDKTSIILIEKRNISISRLKQWKHCRGGDCNTGTGHDPFEITKEQFDRRGSSTRVDGHSLNPFLTMFETTAI